MDIANSVDILQAVIEATPDAIFVKDLDGRYIVVNEAAARFLGKSPAEIVGKNDLELYPEEDARKFIEADRQVLDHHGAQYGRPANGARGWRFGSRLHDHCELQRRGGQHIEPDHAGAGAARQV